MRNYIRDGVFSELYNDNKYIIQTVNNTIFTRWEEYNGQ